MSAAHPPYRVDKVRWLYANSEKFSAFVRGDREGLSPEDIEMIGDYTRFEQHGCDALECLP